MRVLMVCAALGTVAVGCAQQGGRPSDVVTPPDRGVTVPAASHTPRSELGTAACVGAADMLGARSTEGCARR
jgi:hypothetical protein